MVHGCPPLFFRQPLAPMIQYKANRKSAADALISIRNLLVTGFVIFALSIAREIIIPLALAGLLTFILAPLVTIVERRVGRSLGVLLVVLLLVSGVGFAGWILTRQLVDLASKLPSYQSNIEHKLHSIRIPYGGTIDSLSKSMGEIQKEIPGGPEPSPSPAAQADSFPGYQPAASGPLPVKVVGSSPNLTTELFQNAISVVVGPLGTAGIVMLLLLFMLLHRENLRSRFLRLVGQGYISATTRAMDDAGARVSRYLSMQFLDNACYGALISIGLYFIGVPNAVLWGALAGVFRFVPYVGTWVGASIPIALSVAISNSWLPPVFTLALFITLELINANAIEPWLYGSSTGVTPMAIIVSAIFWSWLWGPVGLVLSTPLTVCLAVIGRHVKQLEYLSILLSEDEPLAPHLECYQRLLAFGLNETGDLVDGYIKANSITALYDMVLIPVITAAEIDFQNDELDQEHRLSLQQSIRDIIQDLGSSTSTAVIGTASGGVTLSAPAVPPLPPAGRVCCMPVRAERDELAGMMFVQQMQAVQFEAMLTSIKDPLVDLRAMVDQSNIDFVCLSVVAPSTIIHARYLCAKVRSQYPRMKIVIGLWGISENLKNAEERLRASGADEIATSITDAIAICAAGRKLAVAEPALS